MHRPGLPSHPASWALALALVLVLVLVQSIRLAPDPRFLVLALLQAALRAVAWDRCGRLCLGLPRPAAATRCPAARRLVSPAALQWCRGKAKVSCRSIRTASWPAATAAEVAAVLLLMLRSTLTMLVQQAQGKGRVRPFISMISTMLAWCCTGATARRGKAQPARALGQLRWRQHRRRRRSQLP